MEKSVESSQNPNPSPCTGGGSSSDPTQPMQLNDIDLDLGLSTNGKFGVDPTKNTLKRSYSVVPNLVGYAAENAPAHHAPVAEGVFYAPLVRSSSLPAQPTADQVRRRRIEARRRRLERAKAPMASVEKEVSYVQHENNPCAGGVSIGPPSSSSRGNDPSLQQTEGGANQNAAASQAGPNRIASERIEPPPLQSSDRMPYVYTCAHGRPVYGFMYRYSARDFKIICVCHGMFFTPGQFVEHAGGGVVEHPLKHIVVTQFPFPC